MKNREKLILLNVLILRKFRRTDKLYKFTDSQQKRYKEVLKSFSAYYTEKQIGVESGPCYWLVYESCAEAALQELERMIKKAKLISCTLILVNGSFQSWKMTT